MRRPVHAPDGSNRYQRAHPFILNYLNRKRRPPTLSELAKHAEINEATAGYCWQAWEAYERTIAEFRSMGRAIARVERPGDNRYMRAFRYMRNHQEVTGRLPTNAQTARHANVAERMAGYCRMAWEAYSTPLL